MRLFIAVLLSSTIALHAQSASDLEAVIATDMGTVRFEFLPDKAPKHVEQFLKLTKQRYYDDSAFFRILANGVVQGGDPLLKSAKTPRKLWGTGGLNLLPSEYSDVQHVRGIVSTVRIPNKPNSDGSQFFVCLSTQASLDGKFSAFGRVTEGIEILDKISQLPADSSQIAVKPVRITSITLDKKKVEPFLETPVEELNKTVTVTTTLGTLKLKMRPDLAPNHVRNFLKLTQTGWYNGTSFHRLIKGFVAQGGMAAERASGPTHPADRWVHPVKGEFQNEVKHARGLMSMARTSDPDSAMTSFFLCLGPAPHLDGQYSIFAEVIEGQEVLDALEKEEVQGETPSRRIELTTAVID